jgi:type IV fimbrial biogenesis protein FimT
MKEARFRLTMSEGFTLVELLVTMAIMAVLLAVVVPTFKETRQANQLASYVNTLHASLILARGEAVKRNGRVVVCKSADGAACVTAGRWDQGWIVFWDSDNDAVLDAGETLIQRQTSLVSGFHLTGNNNVENYISFRETGAANPGTFTLCQQSSSSTKARQLIVSSAGRPRITKDDVVNCP